MVEDVLRGDREGEAATTTTALFPSSFRSPAPAAVAAAPAEASTGAAARATATAPPARTASLTTGRSGIPSSPKGNRLAEPQVDDDEARAVAEVPRDDGADATRVEQAVRSGHDTGRIGIGGEGRP